MDRAIFCPKRSSVRHRYIPTLGQYGIRPVERSVIVAMSASLFQYVLAPSLKHPSGEVRSTNVSFPKRPQISR